MKILTLIKYLVSLGLVILFFYWYIMYTFEKENSHYEEICSQNINDEKKLLSTLEEWNHWFNRQELYVDRSSYKFFSLKYSILLTFMNKEHEKRLFIYREIRDKNVPMDEYARMLINSNVSMSFSMINLDEFKDGILKKENICYMYQKYVIDVAIYPNNTLPEYDKYCDGLIVSKKFTEEKIKESKELQTSWEKL